MSHVKGVELYRSLSPPPATSNNAAPSRCPELSLFQSRNVLTFLSRSATQNMSKSVALSMNRNAIHVMNKSVATSRNQ